MTHLGLMAVVRFALWGAGIPGLPAGPEARVQPVQVSPSYLSPDGRYLVVLVSDQNFGQVETVRVFANPNTPQAHVIFEQPGDTPLRFIRWHDGGTAEFAFPAQGREAAYTLVLTCQAEACRLERVPAVGRSGR